MAEILGLPLESMNLLGHWDGGVAEHFSNGAGGMSRSAFSKVLAVTAGYAAPVALFFKVSPKTALCRGVYKKSEGRLGRRERGKSGRNNILLRRVQQQRMGVSVWAGAGPNNVLVEASGARRRQLQGMYM